MKLFNTFHTKSLKGDLFGGLTTAIVSLPLALAFGVASGAGPEAGLYGAVIVGMFAAIFGGTSTLISEPTGPMTVIMTTVITNMIAASPENGLAMAFTVVMIAGLFQILLGLLRLGKYVTMMPYSVISGFMSGIGIILILLQIPPFLGETAPAGGVTGIVTHLPQIIMSIKPVEAGLGFLTLFILFFMPAKWKKYAPPQLVALLAGTLISILFFADSDIQRIGKIPTGLPELVLPSFTTEQITTMILDGMVLGMLGSIDSLLTAVISDSLTREEHDSNKELIGQGIGNIVSGFFGGLPGAGATMGTVVNIQTGAKTAISGIVRALILLAVVLGLAKLTEPIPLAVLAAIALNVGINILDWSFIKRAHRVDGQTTMIMYGVMVLTVFVDLIVAVGVGVFIANILTIEKLSELQARKVKSISDADDKIPLSEEDKALLDGAHGRMLLSYLSGPMIFGLSRAISRQHKSISDHDVFVIDLSDVSLMHATVSLAIENSIKDALDAGVHVFLVTSTNETRQVLEGMGIPDLLPEEHFLTDRTEALRRGAAILEFMVDKTNMKKSK